jgi:hypothetical protein
MLSVAVALSSEQTGWLKQTPNLAARLKPIDGLVTHSDIRRTGCSAAAA